MKDQEKGNEERREFLKKAGVGGTAALVSGAVLGSQKVAAKDKTAVLGDAPFKTKTNYSNLKPGPSEASNKFVIELQDWTLNDAALTAVGNALVKAAMEQVKQLGVATPKNSAAAMQGFGQFGQFGEFGQFGSFGQGPAPELPAMS